ncbi:Guanylate cyclase (Partial), partial [Seminavis robusta]|eukprot:Sro1658_g289110.1 Guanylate cyclase (357) ;mRNA; r:2-1159
MRRTTVSPSTSASANDNIKSKDFLSEESEIYDDIERDEVEEIEKGNATQTRSVHLWRVIATLGLSITGICVTGWSYMKLREQEKANFVDAFEQFSTTVGQAAVDEVLRIREAARSFTETLQATAELTNTTWPYYDYYHGLNAFASEQVSAKNMESIGYLTRVRHDQREAYLDFQRTRHEEWVQAGHMDAYGNMDRLFPDLYQDDILGFNNTDFSVTPSPDRDEYYPLAYRFPPPNSYFIVNFDISSINYDDLFASLLSMGNQTLLSNINPYIDGDDAEKEYHAQFHDRLPGDRSDSSFPHSFLFHPVHGPSSSNDGAKPPIVAVVTYPIAWDASLRRLLPDQVKGIIAVARNNCNQA